MMNELRLGQGDNFLSDFRGEGARTRVSHFQGVEHGSVSQGLACLEELG